MVCTLILAFGTGIGLIDCIGTSNIFVLVGGGTFPKYPKNKVIIWDDEIKKEVGEISLKEKVTGISVSLSGLLICTRTRSLLYDIFNLECQQVWETVPNMRGIGIIRNNSIYILGTQTGYVRIIDSHTLLDKANVSCHAGEIAAVLELV